MKKYRVKWLDNTGNEQRSIIFAENAENAAKAVFGDGDTKPVFEVTEIV